VTRRVFVLSLIAAFVLGCIATSVVRSVTASRPSTDALVFTPFAAPRSGLTVIPTSGASVPRHGLGPELALSGNPSGRTGAPSQAIPVDRAPGAGSTPAPVVGTPSPAVAATPRPTVSVVWSAPPSAGHGSASTPAPTVTDSFRLSIRGTASWGYGWSGVVTRLPRGTAICVTGPLGRWCGRSVGYGPAVYTHRIADLSRAVFASICGPLSQGLCRVTLAGA
jgi:hypothetical protein